MRLLDLAGMATTAIRGQTRRTLLSLLGVSIGVAAVITLTALGEGARTFVSDQFSALGTNVIAVFPGKVETTGGIPGFGGVPNDLTVEDAEAVRTGVVEALRVTPVSMGNDTVSYRERSRQVAVLGSTSGMLELRKLNLRRGRFLPEGPWDRGTQVAVLGGHLADELFEDENPLGQVVRIGSWRMRVIGVLATQGVHFGIDMDEMVIVPVATGMRMFNRTSLFRILVETRSVAELDAAEGRVASLLIERHGEEDFTIVTPDAILGSLGSILDVLTLALVGIAAISLSVAGIGIMNVMLVSVSERTEEVGLLKAIGARPRQITSLFLVEAVLISTAGGVGGLLLGQGVVRLATALYPAFKASPPLWAVVAALATSAVLGVLFGVLPARKAMRLDPVAALAGK